MNSGNHVMMLGDLIPWCYERLAGIAPELDSPGFKHVVMHPDFTIKGVDGVTATYPSPYGDIKSCWKRHGDKITWDITIPANTTSTLFLPDGTKQDIESGNHTIEVAGL